MKVLILEFATLSHNTTIIHSRIAKVIYNYLRERGHKAEIYSLLEGCGIKNGNQNRDVVLGSTYDCIVESYGSFYCNPFLYKTIREKSPNARRVWLTIERMIVPYGANKKLNKFNAFISNLETSVWPHEYYDDYWFVDMNLLIYNGRLNKEKVNERTKIPLYYGQVRKDRSKYFKKYIDKNVIVSTSKKNTRIMRDLGCNPMKFIGKLFWLKGKETLNRFKYSIYLEDETTHNNYNCMGTRFYECLDCNVIMFFDKNCQNTINRSGYIIDKFFIVSSTQEVLDKIEVLEKNPQMAETYLETNNQIAIKKKAEALDKIEKIIIGTI